MLIETILAAFEMEEILYELRDHAAGLNAGRWDYIFSTIKKFELASNIVVPDRCPGDDDGALHARVHRETAAVRTSPAGAHAIGGMAAFIPNRRDPAVTEVALAKVREDKVRESSDGYDGTWVAHPDLVPDGQWRSSTRCWAIQPNQKDRLRRRSMCRGSNCSMRMSPAGRLPKRVCA